MHQCKQFLLTAVLLCFKNKDNLMFAVMDCVSQASFKYLNGHFAKITKLTAVENYLQYSK